jgi:hypothetical protein
MTELDSDYDCIGDVCDSDIYGDSALPQAILHLLL